MDDTPAEGIDTDISKFVVAYLTRDPLVFVNPQYDIARVWSAPDFVELDFRQRIVSVVEVSAAAESE